MASMSVKIPNTSNNIGDFDSYVQYLVVSDYSFWKLILNTGTS